MCKTISHFNADPYPPGAFYPKKIKTDYAMICPFYPKEKDSKKGYCIEEDIVLGKKECAYKQNFCHGFVHSLPHNQYKIIKRGNKTTWIGLIRQT